MRVRASAVAATSIPTAPERDRYARDASPRAHGATDVGRVRRQNQDAFGFSPDGRLLVVADGMGGHDFGDVASAIAVETVLELLPAGDSDVAVADPGTSLLAAVHAAHDRIAAEIAGDPLRRKMGTTVLVAWVVGGRVHTCHVGDSRAYVLSGDTLHRITRDHSVVEMLVRTGQVTAGQARFHPGKNQLTQALGLSSVIGPSLNEAALGAGDRLLLCSDGLWGPVAETTIAMRLGEGDVAAAAQSLITEANACGGGDNITVVVYGHDGD